MRRGSKGPTGHEDKSKTEVRNPDHAHWGPLVLPHPWSELTAAESARILEETGVKCTTRFRKQWQGRRLSLVGPPEKIPHAKKVVWELLERQPDPALDRHPKKGENKEENIKKKIEYIYKFTEEGEPGEKFKNIFHFFFSI